MVLTLDALAREPRPVAEIGGKARHLAELVAAGLAVPPALVLPVGAELDRDARAAIATLGEPLAVRSSSPLEDRADHAAPGLFLSRIAVGAGELEAAIAEVRAAATGELARIYAEATGRPPDDAMAVIVQRYIEPRLAGVAYSRAPGRPGVLLIEPRDHPVVEISRGSEVPSRWKALVASIRAAERAIDAPAGLDVEWVEDGERLWLVQARPLRPSPPLRRPPLEALEFARAGRRRWRLDLGHNPEPLSPAQQGLVELVSDRTGAALAIACGYLYEAAAPAPGGVIDPRSLEAVAFEQVEPAADDRLSALESAAPDLESALDGFIEIYRLYDRLSSALAAGRRGCAGAPARRGTPRAHAIALATDERASRATRSRASRLAALQPSEFYGVYAVAWDVAAPPIADPDVLDPPAVIPDRHVAGEIAWLADLCAAIAELDDRLFYRAQNQVRRALLSAGQTLGLGDDVFWLPLGEVRAGRRIADARARAARARSDSDAARELSMPLLISGTERLEPGPAAQRSTLRGRGFGGQAIGSVARLPADPIEPGSIAVAVDMTPADVIAARRASGIALQSGSLLGHAAAMARELEIPIVVQIPGLCGFVQPGERVAIDGDRGLLVRG